MINDVQKYWNSAPCDIGLSDEPVGSRKYFDDLELAKYRREPHILGFADFQRWCGKDVLEIGIGMGCDTTNFARRGARVTGVDLSTYSLVLAKTRLAAYGYDANLLWADAERLCFYLPERKFDLIYSWGVIYHTPTPKNVFNQLQSYCHKDTELRIMLYAKWSARAIFKLIFNGHGKWWKFHDIIRRHSEFQPDCPVAYYYSFAEAKALLAPYFEITSIRKAGLRGVPAGRLFERLFGSHLLITAKLSSARRNYGGVRVEDVIDSEDIGE